MEPTMIFLGIATIFSLGLLAISAWLCIGEINHPAELEFAPEWERRAADLPWHGGPFTRRGA
jgi:hypothetical protein